MKKNLCLQCNKQIQAQTEDGQYNVCIRPECPNYGLLQIGETKLKEFEKNKSKLTTN